MSLIGLFRSRKRELGEIQPLVDELSRVLNLHRDKKIGKREPGRDVKILGDYWQDVNVALNEIGNLAH